jgi:hypothetical protein
MFSNGRWAFGQTGAAQTHLATNGVGLGDVFLFFGLFASRDGTGRHHRIFGYMQVDEVRPLGARPSENDNATGFLRRHPHTIGDWEQNNCLYLGSGRGPGQHLLAFASVSRVRGPRPGPFQNGLERLG